MGNLFLLRHAKSDWGDASLADFDRPINARGQAAADMMGRYLKDEGIVPDLVLVSSAVRTRQTIDRVMDAAGANWAVQYDDALYLADPITIFAAIHAVPDGVKTLMIVGHNPGLEETARRLAGRAPHELLYRLREKYPTATLAGFETKVPWHRLAPAHSLLTRLVRPADLSPVADRGAL
ncbi:SixA phosphatase family protein [Gimibacter soli]|uniref:Histidine phosphatase family protein n=1 Tax=Gimibacter soli TaxID=3024400 RepID=A0AAF0BMM5_9PROT|nr:histidine phosphatase family protein [Gimibacter soli]WCL54765.1 histidine phosphatase family protein [Gimibacter soli]